MLTFCCSADGFASSRGDGPLATHTDDSSVAAPCAPPAYDPPQSVTHPTLSGSSRTAKNLGRDAGYMGNALALLTGRPRAYGYRHTERFLAELAQVGADDTLTEVLARWTSDLWKARLRVIGSPLPVFYIDGRSLAVYADQPLSARVSRAARKSARRSRSSGVARSRRPSAVRDHASRRPAFNHGTTSHHHPLRTGRGRGLAWSE